jgi:hypothetical protein
MITQDELKAFVEYKKETGEFIWKTRTVDMFESDYFCRRWNTRYAGNISGCLNSQGYWIMTINGNKYRRSRLAWLYVYGKFPELVIDHIDGNRSNDSITNLRDVSERVNHQNVIAPRIDSKSGYRGVSWSSAANKWQAGIRINGTRLYLGLFDSPESAGEAYISAKKKYHNCMRYEQANL